MDGRRRNLECAILGVEHRRRKDARFKLRHRVLAQGWLHACNGGVGKEPLGWTVSLPIPSVYGLNVEEVWRGAGTVEIPVCPPLRYDGR